MTLGSKFKTVEQQKHSAATQRSVETEKKETVPHGRMGSRPDGDLYLYHSAEHHQTAARRRVPQRFDLRHFGCREKGLGQEHSQNHRVRVHTSVGYTSDWRRAVRRSTRLSVNQKSTASGTQIVLQLSQRSVFGIILALNTKNIFGKYKYVYIQRR